MAFSKYIYYQQKDPAQIVKYKSLCFQIWTAQASKENDKSFILKPNDWNANVGAGGTVQLHFVVQ